MKRQTPDYSHSRPAWEQIEFAIQIADAFLSDWGMPWIGIFPTAIPYPCHDHVWRGSR